MGIRFVSSLDEQQKEIIRHHAAQGLRAQQILDLGLPELKDAPRRSVQHIIKLAGLVRPHLSERVKQGNVMSPGVERRLAILLKTRGRNLSDPDIVTVMAKRSIKVTVGNIRRMRGQLNIRSEGHAPWKNQKGRETLGRKISKARSSRRQQRYIEMCLSRIQIAQEEIGTEPKQCTLCMEPWYKDPIFFARDTKACKGGRKHTLAPRCRVCMGDIWTLKGMGKSLKEIRKLTQELYDPTASVNSEELNAKFRLDLGVCDDPTLSCVKCDRLRFYNASYFQSFQYKGKLVCIDICLACPRRRFFCK